MATKKYVLPIVVVALIVSMTISAFFIINNATAPTDYLAVMLTVQYADGTSKTYEAVPSYFKPLPLRIVWPGTSDAITEVMATIKVKVSYSGNPSQIGFSGSVKAYYNDVEKDTAAINLPMSAVNLRDSGYVYEFSGYHWIASSQIEPWFGSTYGTATIKISATVQATIAFPDGSTTARSGTAEASMQLERKATGEITELTVTVSAWPEFLTP